MVPVMKLSDVNYTIKSRDTITRGILFTEENSPKVGREVYTEPTNLEEIVSDVDEVIRVEQLLNERKKVIVHNLRQIGGTNLAEMKLVLKDDRPIVYRPYCLSYQER